MIEYLSLRSFWKHCTFLYIWDSWSSSCSLAVFGKRDRRDQMHSLTSSGSVELISFNVASNCSPKEAADASGECWAPSQASSPPLPLSPVSGRHPGTNPQRTHKAVLTLAFDNEPKKPFRSFQWPPGFREGPGAGTWASSCTKEQVDWRLFPGLHQPGSQTMGTAVNSGLRAHLHPRLPGFFRWPWESGGGGWAPLWGLHSWPRRGFGIRPMQVHPHFCVC